MRIAVLDLGSTSFRLVVAEVDAEGVITHRFKERAALNLGLVAGRSGTIPDPHAAAAVETLIRFREHADRSEADRVITVATSALRDAANREELTDRFERAVGGPIRILSGEEEAALTFAAIRAGLRSDDRTILGLDLGGGSLELVIGEGADPVWVESLPLGASRLTGMFVGHDRMRRRERRELEHHLRETLRPAAAEVHGRRPTRWIASGGTVKALARLIAAGAPGPRPSIHGLSLTRRQLRRVSDDLVTLRRAERLLLPGIGRHRVDAIACGAVVLATVTEVIRAEILTVSEYGLRDGIILEALELSDARTSASRDGGELVLSG